MATSVDDSDDDGEMCLYPPGFEVPLDICERIIVKSKTVSQKMLTQVHLDAETLSFLVARDVITNEDARLLSQDCKGCSERIVQHLVPAILHGGKRSLEAFYRTLVETKSGRLGHEDLAENIKKRVGKYLRKVTHERSGLHSHSRTHHPRTSEINEKNERQNLESYAEDADQQEEEQVSMLQHYMDEDANDTLTSTNITTEECQQYQSVIIRLFQIWQNVTLEQATSRERETESQECGSEAPAMVVQEEWEVIAEFIQHSLGKDYHKDVLPALLNELKVPHHLHPLSREELSVKLQAMVKERRMSCFQFAKFLLRSEATRPFIFDFTEHTGVSIPSVFKNVLMRRLGADLWQLGLSMNLPRTDIDDIRDNPDINLRMKIHMFLTKYKFPSFKSDRETAEFLVEALERASLPGIAAEVKRDLEHELDIEDIGSIAFYHPNPRPEDGIFHDVGASASAEAVHDHSPHQQGYDGRLQETWDESLLARKQSAPAQVKHLPTDLPDIGPECRMRNEELPVIPVSQNDEGYEVFAVFDGSKSEDDILQIISNGKYSGVCLARLEDNKQLVHFAAERGYANVLMMLHQAGHDITAKMENGQTPFLLAHEAGHTDTVKFLLTCDHNIVNTKDDETGDTDNQNNELMSATDCDVSLEAASAPSSQITQSEYHHQQELVTEDVAEDAEQQAFTEEDCTRLYHKAITKHSTINLHVAKAMTIGPPRVGKTFVRHLLLDLEPPEVSVSTPLMKTAETVSIISPQDQQREMETEVKTCDDGLAQVDSTELKLVHSDMIHLDPCETQKFPWLLMNNASGMQSFLNFLQQEDEASTYRVETAEESAETVITDAVPTPESHAVPAPESLSEDTVEVMDAFTADGVPGCLEEKAVTPPSAVAAVASRIHQLLQSPDITNFEIPDCKLLQFLDCGGQQAYHDILPVFTTIPAVYLHVFNINVDLQDHPVDQICFSPGDEVYASARSPLSIAGMISRSVMTVNSLVDKNMQLPPGVLRGEPPEPHIVMVGTHLDELAAGSKEAIEETFKSVNKELNEALPSRHLKEMLVRNQNPHLPAMFFPVGRLSPQPNKESESLQHTTKQSICALKQRIEKLVSAVKVKVPVKWYLYAMLDICQSKEDCKPVYKYSDLFQLCRSEHAVEDCGEFHAMVTYFHALGLMIHLCGKDVRHRENSTCWVFTNPSYLFENISKLYQVQFLEEDRCEGSLQTLRSQGRLTWKALRALNVDNTYLSEDDFLTLLVQLFIGADITEKEAERKDDRVLFVPSVIPVTDATYLHTVITRPSCPYFIITFESKFFLPCGVFTGVIARLQSIPHWKMCYGEHSVSRLHAKFSIGALDTVYVIDNSTHIKVAADIHGINDITSAEEFRNTVIDAVAQSYCFLFHGKAGKGPECKFCEKPFLVLGLLCHCTTCETKDIAELHTDCSIPKSVRCRSSQDARELHGKQALFFWNIKHNAVKRDQHTLPKAKVESQCPPQRALPFSASQFLEAYETEFFEVVNAKKSLLKLKRKGVIPLDVRMAIDKANDEDAKDILFEHLEKNATVDTLRLYCDVAIDANGLPKMQALGKKMREALPPGDVQEAPMDRPQLPPVSHSTTMQKDQAIAIRAPNPLPTRPQHWVSDEVATPIATGPLDDKPPVLEAYHDNLKMQSSQFTLCSSLPTQHCPSHPGHTGWSSSGPQLNMGDVKERLSGSDSENDATGGAHDGSCVVDHSSASSFPLQLSKQSQSQKSERLTGPEHTSMSAHSHSEAQSGAKIQSRAFHGSHTPDQSNMALHSLWEMAKMPAVHTSAEVFSLIQSQHQKGSPDDDDTHSDLTYHLHSDVVATSEPAIGVKGSFDLPTLHHSLQKPSAPAPLARSPGPVHSSVTPPRLSSQHPNSLASLALPHSPGSVNASGTLPHVSMQQTNSSLSLTLPPLPEGFSDCDASVRQLKPPATNSTQFLQMRNSSRTGFPVTSDQTHPSLSIIPTQEHSSMAHLASHPTQQTAPNVDSLDSETSDDDACDEETSDDTPSDLTCQSSTTSGSTTPNLTTEDSRNSSLSQALHPPVADMQPSTASLTPAVATAGSGELTSFVDMHPAVGPHSNVTGDKQPQNSDQSVQAVENSSEWQLSAHQQPTTHPNPSVNVPSHLEPAVVGLPPSEVPSMIDKSAETYPFAATVVEAAHEADRTGAPASSSPVVQPLAVSCKVGSSAVPSILPDVHWQDPGYLGSHHFVSSNILHRHTDSMEPSDRIQMDSYLREQESQAEAPACESWSPAKKEMEWDVIAKFIQHSLGKNCHKDVLPSLLYEQSASHSSLSQEELSAELQAMVKERQMSCFHFALFLLRSRIARPFIFEFAEYTGDSIHYEFKQVLKKCLGRNWYQLACGMNLPKTDIDTLRETPGYLPSKTDMFLTKYRFPSFKSDRETAEFLVEVLEKVGLPGIAVEFKRDLEHELDIEAKSQECGSEAPAMVIQEEWEVIAEFIQHFLGRNCHRDVLPALLTGLKGPHHLHRLSQEELSAKLQAMVKERQMSCFQFAMVLLRFEATRPFIFDFTEHIGVPIHSKFKNVLIRRLGPDFCQLALAMNLPRTDIHDIRDKPGISIQTKIDMFLSKLKFPSFTNDQETAEFLIAALQWAHLPVIAAEVKRDLEHELDIKEIQTEVYLPNQRPEYGIFHEVVASASAEAVVSPSHEHEGYEERLQETWNVRQLARRQSATYPQAKHLPTGLLDTGPEYGMRKDELPVIPISPSDDGYEIFAVFDGSKSEDDILETISSAKYSGVCFARLEDNKQLVHFAAEKGYANVLMMLQQAGHDITAKMENGKTPFLLACEAGHAETVKYLVTCDCNIVNNRDNRSRSCLHFPAMLRNKDLTYDLIWDWNAKINTESITGITPLSVGCIMGDLSIVKNLVQNLTLSHCRKPCKTSRLPPLHAAAFGGHQHIMEYLLTLQGDEDCESIKELLHPDYRSEHQYTALHIAACKGHLQIVQMLVEMCNCAVNASAREEATPLLLAAASGHEDVVEYLLDHRAYINSMREVRKGIFHLTPLGEAALGRHVEVVKVLLDRGADYTIKAGGTTSILALACIGGNQEIVQLLLSILQSDIEKAFEQNEFHDIFEIPFVASMDFGEYKCAKQIIGQLSEYCGNIDDVISVFSKKAQPRTIAFLKQYKEAIAAIPDTELPNQGDTCRPVVGSRSSPMYHLCYDDGPHWATEPMQLCFMFESLHKPERFRDIYEEVYVAASKCILFTLMQQGYSTDELASIAYEKGSEEAAQFFLGYHENQSRLLFLEQVHSGNPSAMGICCELVSAGTLQEVCTSDDVSLVAQQYFMEMSKRDLKHPGQFVMKFSSHGGADVCLQKNGQVAPIRRPPRSLHHSSAVQNNTAGATPAPDSSRTRPQVLASGKVATPTATGPLDEEPMIPQVSASKKLDTPNATLPLEARSPLPQVSASKDLNSRPAAVPLEANPPTLDAAGSMNPQYNPDPQRLKMDVKQTPLDAAEELSLSCNVITDSDLRLPVICTQLNDSTNFFILHRHTVSTDCDWLRTQPSPYVAPSFSPTRHRELDSSTPSGHLGWSHRSDEQRHLPDVRAALVWSDSFTADAGGANDSKIEHPPPSTSPLLKVHQLSQSQNASVAQKSDRYIGPEHTSKNAPPHAETPSGVRSQSHTSHGNCTPDQSSIAPNPLWELAEKSYYLSQLSQHQKSSPGNAEKSVCVTAPGLKQHCDATATSEPVIDVKESCDLPSPHHSLQKPSAPAPLARSPGPVHSSVTLPHLSPVHSTLTKEHSLSSAAGCPTQQDAPESEGTSEEETSGGDDDAHSDSTYQSFVSATATHTRANHLELPLSVPTHSPAHHSQPPTTLHNRSVNVSSHMEPVKVRLPPSEVPSMIDTSAETYPSAATVVEAAHEADASAVPASSSPTEQPLAVSCKVGSSAVPSTLPDVHQQNSGYLSRNQYASSNILHRHLGSNNPSDQIQMDSYRREHYSQECVQHAEPLIGSSKREGEMLAFVSHQMGQKWSMLARYAGLEEDEIQEIKQSTQDCPCATVKKLQERLTWNELLVIAQKHMRMLNTAAKLQHFLGRPVDALPDLVHNEIDPQQYSKTILLASQCVSEHWKELAQYLGVDPHQHWDVLEKSSDADERCHEVLLLWLRGRRATLQELLEAVESTSAAAGSLQQLIDMTRLDGNL